MPNFDEIFSDVRKLKKILTSFCMFEVGLILNDVGRSVTAEVSCGTVLITE